MNQGDYYQILGVSPETDAKEIKAAYRDLALKYHPDRNENDPEAADKMSRVNEAYAVLSDDGKRREYDRMRQQFGSSAAGKFRQGYSDQDLFKGSDIEQIFEEISKSFGLRGFGDLFKDAGASGFKTFNVKEPGFSLRGFFFFGGSMGQDKIRQSLPPGGIFNKLPRMLGKMLLGGQAVNEGGDRFEPLTLSETMARDGGPYAYFHKDLSKKLIVHIPPGTREGQLIRLAGMGDFSHGTGGTERGNLYLQVKIKRTLGEKLKHLIGGDSGGSK
ncbi:MAG: DnaJ domain-containing protein [Desulfobacteraceae bacterium]|nr:DnaJ domain-containing protein [Desulfobacteraceae bacterium]